MGWGIVAVWLLVGGVQTSVAQRLLDVQTDGAEQAVWDTYRSVVHLQLDGAFRLADDVERDPNGGMAATYLRTATSMAQAFVTGDPADYDVFWTYSDRLKAVVRQQPESKWQRYVDAENNIYRTAAHMEAERVIRAAWAGRDAFKQLEALHRDYPEMAEPLKSLGLLHIAIGSLPKGYQRLLRIVGFNGTVSEGLAELRQAQHPNALTQVDAAVCEALLDGMWNNSRGGAVALIDSVAQAWPESPLVAYARAHVLNGNRRAREVAALLEPLVYERPNGEAAITYASYYLAEAYFKLNRFADAERALRHYLQVQQGEILVASAKYRLGLVLELQGQREEALAWYRQVEALRNFDSDDSAERNAKKRLQEPLSATERQLLLGRNAYDAGEYAEGIAILQPIADDPAQNTDARSEAAYRLGRIYHAQGDLEASLEAYAASEADAVTGTRWAPYSAYYAGEVWEEKGDLSRAKAAFDQAMSYSGKYDHYQGLQQRVKAGYDRLAQRGLQSND
ncbi:MAG: hypothetical protein RhofKO_20860 [Rhodothermales bacterium]